MTSLDDLLRVSDRLTTVHVERWVARGLLRPSRDPSDRAEAWHFEPIDVARVRLLTELGDEAGFDDDTVEALVALIDQVHTLRGQLRLVASAIAEQPPETRRAISAALQRLAKA